jgi:hypothetical protein
MRPYLLLVAVGCAGDSGALDQSGVTTECSPTDFACVTAGLDGPVAVGGVVPLALDTELGGSSAPAITLLSADPAVLKAAGTEVVGQAPGVAALVLLTDAGAAVDFLHVFVAAPKRVGLHRRDGGLDLGELVGELDMLVGDELVIEVDPYLDSQRLLGRGASTWTTGAELTLLRDGVSNRRRVVARTPGETTLTVEAFGFDKTLTIRVLP